MQDLGSIGADRSEALSVNNLGQVVGRAEGFSIGTHAFVYENGHVVDLNSIIPDLRGWELLSATDINNHGQIVGLGRHDGNLHGYLLLPERSVAELIEHLIEVTGTFAEDEPSVSGLIAKLSTARDSFARDSSKAGCNQIRAYVHLLDSRNRPILAPHIDYFVETAREITQRAACP
jgi:probable HAF family extracellular repeat protein